MTQDEIKEIVEQWKEKRESLPCPMARGGQGQNPVRCQGCRFWVPAVIEKVPDPKITVVGNKPPEPEIMWQCEFDLISSELSAVHRQLAGFLAMMSMAAATAGPRPGAIRR